MKALYDLKEKFYEELEELAHKGELGAGDLELAHKLTDTIKNINKICMLEEDGGYSQTGRLGNGLVWPWQQLPGPQARFHGTLQP